MNRSLALAVLSLCLCGCETTSPSSYVYYEVVHSPTQIAIGDSVRIETKDGATFRGIALRTTEGEIVVTTETQGRMRVPWRDIRKLERVVKAEAKE